ncbi:MAG: hypothetical protein KDD11_13315 [Acidobacteria bacterium]|nr:hypothetical protein [Acidobacteriota bacterium]
MRPSTRSDRLRLAALVAALAVTLLAADLVVAWRVRGEETAETGFEHGEEVRVLPREPADLPPPEPRPSLLLLGNSHTYALPGLAKGEPLRPDAGATVIDDLASGVKDLFPTSDAVFDRLSYPNFLPFEMLTRYAQLSFAGYRPRVVVLGITWRNVARDRQLRHQVHLTYEIPGLTEQLLGRLERPDLGADPRVLAAARAEERQVEEDRRRDRQRSSADRFEARLDDTLGRRVALIGDSAEVRARVYRELAYAIDTWLVPEQDRGYSYDLIEDDLELNVASLEVLFRWLAEDGAKVIVYRAPERSDLAPLLDPRREDEVLGGLETYARSLGFVTVDARDAVPAELWGWERDTPDRSHFTEPGHLLLARRLLAAGSEHGVWAALGDPESHALQ